MYRHFAFGLCVWAFGFALTTQAADSANPSFYPEIAPILRDSCFGCHGSKNPKGKLDLTKYEAIRKGGTKTTRLSRANPRIVTSLM